MNVQTKVFYAFGPYRLDPGERRLLRDGKPIALSPKLTETLLLLIQNAGHVVDKAELIRGVWPDTIVEEGNLNKNVFLLRKTLGQCDGGFEYIETVPKRGYRFVGPVRTVVGNCNGAPGLAVADSGASPISPHRLKIAVGVLSLGLILGAGWRFWSSLHRAPSAAIHSIAVLPLENLSGDSAQDYFADGMTDELITQLGQIGGSLRVISRTSSMRYKRTQKPLPQIAQELNVDAIVEGTVTRSGDQVRIRTQLIQVAADKHLWARSYEGNTRDVLQLQREVANAVAEQIRIELTPDQQAALRASHQIDPDSYEEYLRGHYLTQTGKTSAYAESIDYFNRAITKDARNAQAFAALADSYIILGHMVNMTPQRAFPAAREAATRALQLDDSLADAHQSIANVKFLYEWDFAGAEREFRRALELNPNSVTARAYYADYLIAMGKADDSIAERKRNLQIDPLALRPTWALATGYFWAHRYDEAITQSRRVIEMDPHHWSGHLDLGLALEQKGEFPAALAELRKAIEVSDDKTWIAFVAHAMAISGDRVGGEKIASELQQLSKVTYVSPWAIAMIYSGTPDKDTTFAWLEKSYQGREHDLVFSKVWPMFDSLRSDPKFQNLMRRVGLPQ
jgi:TolB-like protein/DNA-binding winged helix-turn-helix (wHTH) protein/Tfp pilus assembly protein PilF